MAEKMRQITERLIGLVIVGFFVLLAYLLSNLGTQTVSHIDGGGDYSNAVPKLYVDFLRRQQDYKVYLLKRSDICKYWDKDC